MTLRIALTPGEPAGIGPDLCLMLAQTAGNEELVVIADPEMLQQRADALQLPILLRPFEPGTPPRPRPAGELRVLTVPVEAPVVAGKLNQANAAYVLKTLDQAIDGCLAYRFAALVTGPVHKGIINDAGIPFSGHTEYLQARTQSQQVVMMLTAPGLRVALATTHLPLHAVSAAITRDRLRQVIEVLHRDLQYRFGISRPRILVCGLNPHAGEGGHLGTEEGEVIEPVLNALRAKDMTLVGPLPADTLFTPRHLEQADAVLAMYHDQGLPVLKHMGFGEAVNITLGLPIIRTSVDHGTALELAGSGKAQVGSLVSALNTALLMARSSGNPA